MNILNSLKEYAEDLYRDGIRTVRKFIVPVVLASTLGITSACGPSALPTPIPTVTPTPTPFISIQCKKISDSLSCYKDGKKVLTFQHPTTAIWGDTVDLKIFVYNGIVRNPPIRIEYKSTDENNAHILTLSEVPSDKEVMLKFKPYREGDFDLYVKGVEPDAIRTHICFGGTSKTFIKSDTNTTTPYNSVLIYAKTEPPIDSIGIDIFDQNSRIIKSLQSSSDKPINWIPETPGVYRIIATGNHSCTAYTLYGSILPSTSEPLTIVVK